MFNSPVIDLVILLSFTYFIGSLILSAINEAIASTLRLRQKQLKIAIENMFFDEEWKTFIKDHFNKSAVIQSLMKRKGRYPAYIAKENFVLGVINFLGPDNYNILTLASTIQDNPVLPESFKKVMLTLLAQSQGNIKVFEKNLAEFYDSVMDRATGWYKKRIRRILLILAVGLSVALNIDTIKIAKDAMADKQKLANAVDNIAANLPALDSLKTITVTDSSLEVSEVQTGIKRTIIAYQKNSGFFLGYTDFFKEWSGGNFFTKLIGILITAFALQLGSNYWFDIMNKAVNIRAVGKRPDEKRPPQD